MRATFWSWCALGSFWKFWLSIHKPNATPLTFLDLFFKSNQAITPRLCRPSSIPFHKNTIDCSQKWLYLLDACFHIHPNPSHHWSKGDQLVNFGTTEVVCPSSFTLMITIVKNWATLEASSWPTRFVWGHDLGVQAWCCEGWVGWAPNSRAQLWVLSSWGWRLSVWMVSLLSWRCNGCNFPSVHITRTYGRRDRPLKNQKNSAYIYILSPYCPKKLRFSLFIHVVSSRQDLFPKEMTGT